MISSPQSDHDSVAGDGFKATGHITGATLDALRGVNIVVLIVARDGTRQATLTRRQPVHFS
jgi:hypothetical protein